MVKKKLGKRFVVLVENNSFHSFWRCLFLRASLSTPFPPLTLTIYPRHRRPGRFPRDLIGCKSLQFATLENAKKWFAAL